MSNFLKEFKEFACRGNVVDMAVGVTIGAAFGKVVTSFIEIFLNPILEKLTIEGGSEGIVGSLVRFAAVVVEFILIAFFLFLVVKAFNIPVPGCQGFQQDEGYDEEGRSARGSHHQGVPLLPERNQHQGDAVPALHQRVEIISGGFPTLPTNQGYRPFSTEKEPPALFPGVTNPLAPLPPRPPSGIK